MSGLHFPDTVLAAQLLVGVGVYFTPVFHGCESPSPNVRGHRLQCIATIVSSVSISLQMRMASNSRAWLGLAPGIFRRMRGSSGALLHPGNKLRSVHAGKQAIKHGLRIHTDFRGLIRPTS